MRGLQSNPSGFEPDHRNTAAKRRRKEEEKKSTREEDGRMLSGHDASPSACCPILSKVPLSTNQIITPTTAVTNAMKKIQKHQQTMVRFFFLLFWRASHESL